MRCDILNTKVIKNPQRLSELCEIFGFFVFYSFFPILWTWRRPLLINHRTIQVQSGLNAARFVGQSFGCILG